MRIVKIFNNNVLLARDESGSEVVLIGRGLAFQKKAGEAVDESKVLQTFVLSSNEIASQFNQLMQNVSPQVVSLTIQIIEMAEDTLDTSLNGSIVIGLADHISYAVERVNQGQTIRNMLVWEVKKFYEKEFAVAQVATQMIEAAFDVTLNEDEAGFIALHFVNAQQDNELMNETILLTQALDDIFSIVQLHYGIVIDQDSLNYMRFSTHVRYFLKRALNHEAYKTDDDELFYQIKEKYEDAYTCTYKIKRYLKEKMNIEMTHDEMTYFMLHINRVAAR